ncbi:MAG TPA: hypothetical protein VF006_16160 [Longimicrobium sp.]
MRHTAADPPEPEHGSWVAIVETIDGQAFVRIDLVIAALDIDRDEITEVPSAQAFRDVALEYGFAKVGELVVCVARLYHGQKLITPISHFKRTESPANTAGSGDS